MVGLGIPRREVDELTLADLLDLNAYWRRYPPVVELVAWASGWSPPKEAADRAMGPPSLTELEMIVARMNAEHQPKV